MAYKNLQIKVSKGVVILTINREKALNALNHQTLDELQHFFTVSAPRRKTMKGIVITGAGQRSFVAGADIKEFLSIEPGKSGAEFARRGQNIFQLIERFHKPVIAAVNGFALGGGCELAMACHLRIAGENAKFGQPEVNLGILPGYGGTQRLPQLVGKGKALEMMMTGDMIDAHEAHRIGLVNHVVAAGEEVIKAKELIGHIATKAPLAVAGVIRAVEAYYDGVTDGFSVEAEEFGQCTATNDFREGARAFIERRKPEFTAR